MRKKFPVLKTDEEADAFLQQDLSDYLHAGNFASARFEFQPKDKSINLRIPNDLLTAVQDDAKRQGIPYQRYIRLALERSVATKPKPGTPKKAAVQKR
jgi:predicted DNA binding CopG/RHH family protein